MPWITTSFPYLNRQNPEQDRCDDDAEKQYTERKIQVHQSHAHPRHLTLGYRVGAHDVRESGARLGTDGGEVGVGSKARRWVSEL